MFNQHDTTEENDKQASLSAKKFTVELREHYTGKRRILVASYSCMNVCAEHLLSAPHIADDAWMRCRVEGFKYYKYMVMNNKRNRLRSAGLSMET